MKLKPVFTIVLALAFLLMAVGCAPAAAPTTAPSSNNAPAASGGKTIKVGVLAPISGPIAAYGQDQVNAVNMAVEEINAAGGILGAKLTVQVEDDEKKPELAASLTQKLIDAGVDVIIGGMSSSSTMAGGPIADRAKVLMISPWSTNPKAAEGDWVFRACFSDEFQGKIEANYLVKMGCKRPAMLLDVGDDGSKGQGEVVTKTLKEAGVPLIASESYTSGDKDFRAQLTKIKALNPDCLVTPNYYGEDALIRVQMKELGMIDLPMIGGDGNDAPEFFTIGGDAANGFMMTTHYAPDDPRQAVQDFRKKFEAKFNMVPRSTAALSYDAVMLYKMAAEKANSLDKNKIREALAGLKDVTTLVTAPTFSMDATGTGIKSLAVVKAQGGNWVFESVVNP